MNFEGACKDQAYKINQHLLYRCHIKLNQQLHLSVIQYIAFIAMHSLYRIHYIAFIALHSVQFAFIMNAFITLFIRHCIYNIACITLYLLLCNYYHAYITLNLLYYRIYVLHLRTFKQTLFNVLTYGGHF